MKPPMDYEFITDEMIVFNLPFSYKLQKIPLCDTSKQKKIIKRKQSHGTKTTPHNTQIFISYSGFFLLCIIFG